MSYTRTKAYPIFSSAILRICNASILQKWFLIFGLVCLSKVIFGQCLDGTEPSCQCSTAPLLCNIGELDGYTYGMSTYLHASDGPDPMCTGSEGAGTTSHNPTWFAFISWCTDLTLGVTYDNCVTNPNSCNSLGIQAAVYSNCSLTPGSAVECDTDVGGCTDDGYREMVISGLTIGDTYYFLVDGCCGSACDILIEVIGECGFGDIAPWNQEIQGEVEVCLPDDTQLYTVTKLDGANEYYWTVNGNPVPWGTASDPDLPLHMEYTFPGPGLYDICVDVDKEPCISVDDFPPQLCRTICVLPEEAEAGIVSANPTPTCPGTDISFDAVGYNTIPELTQYMFITDNATGEIIQVDAGDSGTFNSDMCGDFTVYSYNFKDNDVFDPPMIGQTVADIADCDTTCFCAMEPLDIEVEDNEDPVFLSPPSDLDIDCYDGLAAIEDLDWTDNCAGSGTVSGTEVGSADLCDGGTYTRSWTFTDECDNTVSYDQTITVGAVPEAVFDMPPGNVTIECFTELMAPGDLDFTNSAAGSCLIEGTAIMMENIAATQCGGTVTYTWSNTDLCGRVLDHEQIVTVMSIAPPVFTDPPMDITYTCIDAVPIAEDLAWTSNCGGSGTVSVMETDATDACLGGTITRYWEYTDPCGQMVDHTQIITIDPVPDVVWTSTLPVDIDVVCGQSLPPLEDLNYSNSGDGACLEEGVTSPVVAGTHVVCGDVITRTWTFTPTCGATLTYTQNITLVDTESPVFTDPPMDITYTCISEVPAASDLTWTDNCDGTGAVPVVEMTMTDACLGGTITRTWNYSDACGNPVEHTQTITVDPVPETVWTGMIPADITISCADMIPTLDPLNYSNSAPAPACLDEGSVPGMSVGDLLICGDVITRTWEYTPTCGAMITHTQTIELEDLDAPTWVDAPMDISYDCISEVPAMADLEWNDNCDGSGVVPGVEDDMTAGCDGGTITRTWEYTDACGNPSMHTQTITVNPIPPVVWTSPLPMDESITCDDAIPTLVDLDYSNASAIPSCLDAGTAMAVEVGMLDMCGDEIVRTWEYMTSCGELLTHTQTITLVDTDPAVWIDPPMDETYDCILDVPVAEDLVWTDICDGTGSVSPSEDDMTVACTGGNITRTWEYTDACGNPSMHVQTIIVNPVPDVVWTSTLPTDVILQCGDAIPDAEDLNYSNSSASANCLDSGTITPVEMGDLVVCGDMITRTWEYTPICGPAIMHVQTITLEDMIAPEFVDPPADETFDCLADVTPAIDLEWTDNCDGTGTVMPTINEMTDPCIGGTITRLWEYTDMCGNPVSHTQTISIEPVPDVIWTTSLPMDVVLDCGDAIPDAIDLDYSNGLSAGSCAAAGTISPIEVGEIMVCGDMITRTWEFVPECGPTLTHVQTITLEDNEPPMLIDPLGDATYDCLADVPPSVDLDWTDNCDGAGSIVAVESGMPDACSGGTITRLWEYTDMCGNPATHTQTITVNPVPPVTWTSSLPSDISINCGEDVPLSVDLSYSNSSISMSCLDQGSTSPTEVGTLVNCGDMIIRTWEYVPTCGAALMHTQTITLEDDEAPEFVSPPANITVECFSEIPIAEDLAWTDNCDGTGSVSPTEVADYDNCNGGTIIRSWTYTDNCGNPANHDQTIEIQAVPNVVWTSPLPNNIVINCGDAIPDLVELDYSNSASIDACLEEGTATATETGNLVSCGDQIIRTWEVIPACGPTITHTQTITLDDIEPPVFVNTPPNTLNITCLLDLSTDTDLTWEDNCDGTGVVSYIQIGEFDECSSSSVTRIWDYTDSCGNGPVTFTQIINLAKPIAMPCDDGDDCTINDEEVVTCDGKECVPCAGTPTDCSGMTEEFVCDDGDECTINDIVTIACNGDICIPCQGTPATCDDGITFTIPCNDLDPCTINDMVTLDCQDDICVPCAGIPNPTPDPIVNMINPVCIGESGTIIVEGCEDGFNTWYRDAAGTDIVFIGSEFETPPLVSTTTYWVDCTLNECQSELVEVIIEVVTPEPAFISGDDFICESETSTLTINPEFADYDWNNGDNTQTITINEEGDYSVTVTDFNGCTSTADFSVTVAFNPFITIAGSTTFCAGGSAVLTAPFGYDSYAWEPNFENGFSVTASDPGIYTVTVTDLNGCTGSSSVEVTEAEELTPNISGGDSFCFGGSVELSIGEGFSNVTWQPNGETTSAITVTEEGTYTVIVEDGTCMGSASVFVGENPLPTPMIDAPAGICPNDLASLSAQNNDYTNYIWSTGQVSANILTDTPGTYAVTVTDVNGCTASTSVEMDFIAPPIAEINGDSQLCPEAGSSLILSATTDPDYSYAWSTGDMSSDITVTMTGTYILTVTDENNCSSTASAIIGNHQSPNVVISGSQSFCTDGSTEIDAGEYVSYIWAPNGEITRTIDVSTEGVYTVTVTDINGCTGSSSTTIQELTELLPIIGGPNQVCPGEQSTLFIGGNFASYAWSTGDMDINTITVDPGSSYSVTVTDASGCTGSSLISVSTYNVTDVTITGDDQFCAGSITELVASAGYQSYTWSNGSNAQMINVNQPGTYTVEAIDINGCTTSAAHELTEIQNPTPSILGTAEICTDGSTILSTESYASYAWSNGSMDQNTTVIAGGAISVTVTDDNGCTGSTSLIVTEFNLPSVNISGSPSFCIGGFTTLGTVDNYTSYLWSPNGEVTETIQADSEGTYTVQVTDENGCTASTSISVTIETSLSPTINGDNILCQGESQTLSVGTFDQYEWSTGAMTQTIDVNSSDTYAVTVYDASGCSGETSFEVSVVDPIQVDISGNTQLCVGGNTTLSAGSQFVTYNWSNGFNTESISVNTAGIYTVTVTDINGCETSTAREVVEVPLPSPIISGDPNYCLGGSTELGLSDSYISYIWSTGSDATTIDVSSTGLYSVTVTDDNGCQASSAINVFTYPEVNPTIGGSTSFCPGGNTTLDGGSTYVAWEWSTGEMTQTIQFDQETTVSLTVTDINGCTGSSSISVTQEDSLSPSIIGDTEICAGESTIFDAGAAFDTWAWSTGDMTQTIEVTEPGIYMVSVTQGTCSGVGEIELIVNPLPEPEIDGPESICFGESATLTSINTYAAYQWTTGDVTKTTELPSAGDYTLIVTDANGCTAFTSFTVEQKPTPTIADINTECGEDKETYDVTFTTSAEDVTCDTYPINMVSDDQYEILSIDTNDVVEIYLLDITSMCDTTITITKPNCSCGAVADAGPDQSLDCETFSVILGGENTIEGAEYTYSWTNEFGTQLSTEKEFSTGSPGTYTLEVFDSSLDCSVTSTVVVDDITNDPSAEIFVDPDNVIDCEIGEVTLTSAQEENVIYQWSAGALETQAISINIDNGVTVILLATDTITHCSNTSSIVIEDNEQYPIINIAEPDVLNCNNSMVTIDASNSQKSDDITYTWTNAQGATLGDTENIQVTTPGWYYLALEDVMNGCENDDSIYVSENLAEPTVMAGEDVLIPCDVTSVSINATVEGTADIVWTTQSGAISSGESSTEATVTQVGVYYFNATNPETGCTATDSVEVLSNDDKVSEVNLDIRQPECFEDETGDMTISVVAGGTPPFTYSMDGLSNSDGIFNNLLPGAYEVLITDALGCLFLSEFEIIGIPEVTFSSPTADIQLDYGSDTTLVLETNLPLDQIAEIIWMPEIEGGCTNCLNVPVENATVGQTYQVTLIDINGCTVTTTIRVDVDINVDIYVPNVINPNSNSGNDRFFPKSNIEGITIKEFMVFDRWGEMVHYNKSGTINDPSFGWDGTFNGKPVVSGVYVYYMIYDIPGLGEQKQYGDLTVIY